MIVVGGVLLGAATVVIVVHALGFLGHAMDIGWLRDVGVNTGPLAVAGGGAAGGAAAAAAGDGIGDLPLPTPGTPAPPPLPGVHFDPTTKTFTSGPESEGPPRSAAPHDDVPWQIHFARWVEVIAGSGDRTTQANAGVVN